MPKKNIDQHYIDVAHLVSQLSWDDRIQVGCIVVKEQQIISQGYNGTPAGMDNKTREDGRTKPTVIHSEANALMKLAKNGGGAEGSSLYCTHSPCYNCALLIIQSGITRVIYDEVYCHNSLNFMIERGIDLEQVKRSRGILTGEGEEG